MKATRYSTTRQKACLECSTAKTKCERTGTGTCARCALRRLSCHIPPTLPPEVSIHAASNSGDERLNNSVSTLSAFTSPLPRHEHELPAGTVVASGIAVASQSRCDSSRADTSMAFSVGHLRHDSRSRDTSILSEVLHSLDLSLELFCPINPEDIRNRWLNSFVPVPGQKIKDYPPSITAFIYRILKSYAAVTVHGRGVPPFVHASQTMGTSARPPLSTCLTLVRLSQNPLPGSESVAVDVLQREMNSIYDKHRTYDDMGLLAAFQAYLIYSMVLFFRLSDDSKPFFRQAMMNLQDLACSTSRRGLVCIAEQQRTRPRWEAWIVAEAKRRTLFAMYLFDSVLSAQDGIPTFLGTELQGLPAPASQFLWRAHTRQDWQRAYNTHLAAWESEGFHIDELWPIPANLDEPAVLERRSRVDQWLETVDEFGTVLYAVTSCTHGG